MTINEKRTLKILLHLDKLDEQDEYQNMLNNHDWFYFNSGDSRVYQRGYEAEEKLKAMTRHNSTFYFMYHVKRDEVFSKNK